VVGERLANPFPDGTRGVHDGAREFGVTPVERHVAGRLRERPGRQERPRCRRQARPALRGQEAVGHRVRSVAVGRREQIAVAGSERVRPAGFVDAHASVRDRGERQVRRRAVDGGDEVVDRRGVLDRASCSLEAVEGARIVVLQRLVQAGRAVTAVGGPRPQVPHHGVEVRLAGRALYRPGVGWARHSADESVPADADAVGQFRRRVHAVTADRPPGERDRDVPYPLAERDQVPVDECLEFLVGDLRRDAGLGSVEDAVETATRVRGRGEGAVRRPVHPNVDGIGRVRK